MKNAGIKRIAIVGPECTGKSDLAKSLAIHFKTEWVPEFAREYLNSLKRPYEEDDLVEIAKGQLVLEREKEKLANHLLLCDTTLLVIKIWSEVKYGSCNTEILTLLQQRAYDLHLLTYIDIPWEFDPLREHPHEREYLYTLYKNELIKMKVPFIEIKGDRLQRQSMAITAITNILK